jgi:hypothetical protein
MTAKRCGARTKAGGACQAPVLVDGRHCWQHARRTAARAKETSAAGGRGGANRVQVGPAPTEDLATPAGRWAWLNHALEMVASKRASLAAAETIARVVAQARAEAEYSTLGAELEQLQARVAEVTAQWGKHR